MGLPISARRGYITPDTSAFELEHQMNVRQRFLWKPVIRGSGQHWRSRMKEVKVDDLRYDIAENL